MRNVSPGLQDSLLEMFGTRVTFDRFERQFYCSDVGSLPSLVSPIVGSLLPAGVVQPHTEDELVQLVTFARQHQIPLVPRGKASSGYGGVLPVAGGLVVDLNWMSRIHGIDPDALTVTVGPGVVWRNLEKELGKSGLALTTYPSSAPSSTVAGWLAQGGMGFGAFEYGLFRDTVTSARVVIPTGEVREFAGDELDLISDAEGITGIISAVTLRLRRAEDEAVWGATFENAAGLARSLKAAQTSNVPFWSISFITPQMADMKNQVPPKLVHGHPVESDAPQIPTAYVAIFVAPESRRAEIEGAMPGLLQAGAGEMLDPHVARHEWEERFAIMHVKRLGPSLAPAEVLVNLDGLTKTLTSIEERIKLPMAIEGMVSGAGDVTLLGFILHDERKFSFNFAFALALSVLKIAKENGGRAYSTGLYFAKEANNVLGAARVQRLHDFKRQLDPDGLLNPRKVLEGKPFLSTFMGVAEAFEPIVRVLGNAAKNPIGERFAGSGKRGIPDDVAWYAYACAQCGYCVDDCDQYYGRVWESQSPRAKWKFLRDYMEGKAKWNQKMVDTIMACTTCEMCNVKCPLDLPIEPSWLKLRGQLIHEEKRLTFPPFEIMRASLLQQHNIWGARRDKRADWVPAEKIGMLPEKAEIAYFPGCTASFVEQDIAQGTACLLHKAGVEFTYMGEDEACCGIPMLVAGLWDTWEEIMRHNINGMKARGVKTVVTSCPACWLVWHTFYPEWAHKLGIEFPFETRHYSQLLAEKMATGDLVLDREVAGTYTFHDSCHMGRAGGIFEEPRELIKAVPGATFVEMEHNREEGHCCGSVLSLVADPPAAERIGDQKLQEAVDAGADTIVSVCPCCQVQLRVTADKRGRDLKIMDLGHLICDATGTEHRDSTGYALEQWATFEAMINLLKPEAMSNFMAGMFPEMIDAMPGMFRGMMHMVQKSPAPVKNVMLAVMRPVMPMLFPILLPGIMPKVMPTMLEMVGDVVPMSEDMGDLMPDLMPAAMDNLMPKMLPELMPFIVPLMIDYLRNSH